MEKTIRNDMKKNEDMKKAFKDYHPGASPLSRVPDPTRTYSANRTYGDATLATLMTATLAGILLG